MSELDKEVVKMAQAGKLRKLGISLIIILIGLPQLSETIYTPALPAVASSLACTAAAVESTLSIYFLGFAIGVLLWGVVSDRIGRRVTMLMGLLLYGVSCHFSSRAQTIEVLFGWRLVQAIGASVGSVITQTMLRDLYDGPTRARLFSIVSGALAFSPAVGPLLGGFLSEYFGWRSNFLFLELLAIVVFFWSFWKLPETRNAGYNVGCNMGYMPPHSSTITFSTIRSLAWNMVSTRDLWRHVLLIGGTNGIIFSFYAEAPFIFIECLGYTPSHYGLIGLLLASSALLASYVSCRLGKRCLPEAVIGIGQQVTCVGALLFLIGSVAPLTLGIYCSLFGIGTLFFGIGLIIPNSLSIALKPYAAAAGSAGSIFGGLYYVVIMVATLLMSLLHNGELWMLPLVCLGWSLLLLSCRFTPLQSPLSQAL